MTLIQTSGIVTGVALLAAWLLSSYDARLIGDGGGRDKLRRLGRCLFTAAAVEFIFWSYWRFSHNGDAASGLIAIPVVLLLAYFWAGAVGEIASRGFGKLFDSDGRRAFDPRKGEEGLRQVSELVRQGRQEEALRLSRKLQKSGDTNVIVLEAMLQHLGLDENSDRGKMMAMARELHGERRFTEAERVLIKLLDKHPNDTQAAVLLIRIYAQETHETSKAAAVLQSLEKQPGISPGMIEFARSLLAEGRPEELEPTPAPLVAAASEPETELVDDLAPQWRFDTAIVRLKDRTQKQPADFEAWMKLAEINGRYCGSLKQVENIIRQLEADPRFSPEQVGLLRAKLEEWRKEWKVADPVPKAAESPQVNTTGSPENYPVSQVGLMEL